MTIYLDRLREVAGKTGNCIAITIYSLFQFVFKNNPLKNTFPFFQLFPCYSEEFHFWICRLWYTMYLERTGIEPGDLTKIQYMDPNTGEIKIRFDETPRFHIETTFFEPIVTFILANYFPQNIDGFILPTKVTVDNVLQSEMSSYYRCTTYGIKPIFTFGNGKHLFSRLIFNITYNSETNAQTGKGSGHYFLEYNGENISDKMVSNSPTMARGQPSGSSTVSADTQISPEEKAMIDEAVSRSLEQIQIEKDAEFARRLDEQEKQTMRERQIERDAELARRFHGM